MSATARPPVLSTLTETTRRRFDALVQLQSRTLANYREFFSMRQYVEVAPTSLAEIAGPGETPLAKPDFPFASPQRARRGQLDTLAVIFGRSYYTFNTESQHQEWADECSDPTLTSSYTSIEGVTVFPDRQPESALGSLVASLEDCTKFAIRDLIEEYSKELFTLGCDVHYLTRITRRPFVKITHDEAMNLLDLHSIDGGDSKQPLSYSDAKRILSYFCNIPVIVTYSPAFVRHFSTKETESGSHAYSADLFLPRVGLSGRAELLEERLDKIAASYKRRVLPNPHVECPVAEEPLKRYLEHFGGRHPGLRGGFSFSFERMMCFLLGSSI